MNILNKFFKKNKSISDNIPECNTPDLLFFTRSCSICQSKINCTCTYTKKCAENKKNEYLPSRLASKTKKTHLILSPQSVDLETKLRNKRYNLAVDSKNFISKFYNQNKVKTIKKCPASINNKITDNQNKLENNVQNEITTYITNYIFEYQEDDFLINDIIFNNNNNNNEYKNTENIQSSESTESTESCKEFENYYSDNCNLKDTKSNNNFSEKFRNDNYENDDSETSTIYYDDDDQFKLLDHLLETSNNKNDKDKSNIFIDTIPKDESGFCESNNKNFYKIGPNNLTIQNLEYEYCFEKEIAIPEIMTEGPTDQRTEKNKSPNHTTKSKHINNDNMIFKEPIPPAEFDSLWSAALDNGHEEHLKNNHEIIYQNTEKLVHHVPTCNLLQSESEYICVIDHDLDLDEIKDNP